MAISKRQKKLRIEDQLNPTMVDIRKMNYAGPWYDELLYVERLSAEACISVETLRPMDELFGGIDAQPKPDRQTINARFFAWAEREKPKYPDFDQAKPLTAKHLNTLNSVPTLTHTKQIVSLKQNLKSHYLNLKHYEDTISAIYTNIANHEVQLEAAERLHSASRQDFGAAIAQVTESGNWCLAAPDLQCSGSVIFISRPITVPYFNKEVGIETVLPFGQFAVTVYWIEGGLSATCLGHRDNLNYRNYIHPHINNSGAICFGNNLSRWNKARAAYDLKSCMDIILQTLSNFIPGEGSVYADLSYFIKLAHEARKQGKLGATHDKLVPPPTSGDAFWNMREPVPAQDPTALGDLYRLAGIDGELNG